MKYLGRVLAWLRRRLTLTHEQADHLATLKFPCC